MRESTQLISDSDDNGNDTLYIQSKSCSTIASGLFNRFAEIGAIIWRRAEAKLVMQAETPDPRVCLCGGALFPLRFANRSRRAFERIRIEWVWFLFLSFAAP